MQCLYTFGGKHLRIKNVQMQWTVRLHTYSLQMPQEKAHIFLICWMLWKGVGWLHIPLFANSLHSGKTSRHWSVSEYNDGMIFLMHSLSESLINCTWTHRITYMNGVWCGAQEWWNLSYQLIFGDFSAICLKFIPPQKLFASQQYVKRTLHFLLTVKMFTNFQLPEALQTRIIKVSMPILRKLIRHRFYW